MTQSMTGFGSAERDGYRVEIRSLNSRFLDIYIKAPLFLNQFDIPLRNMLKARFARGKFDVAVSVSESAAADFRVNTALAGRLYAALQKLQKDLSLSGEVDISMMAGFHALYLEADTVYDESTLYKVFTQAMDVLSDMRTREGVCLAEELLKLVNTLAAMNSQIKDLTSDAVREMTEKFNEKIKSLLAESDIDGNRVVQEAALMAIKLDIAEEIARIDSHITHFREILPDDNIGRKLDFIVQELHREVNTISSKSGEYAITSLAVGMKSVIEKIKEQVQNIQ
jgi:uncharacterized protein (TIGR00255 family)